MAKSLSRDAKLYACIAGTALDGTGNTHLNTWELPILSDFSFSQDSGTQDISVTEAGDTPTRGMKKYTTTLNPVDVSFSMYVRPYVKDSIAQTGDERAGSPEDIIWNALVSSTLGVLPSDPTTNPDVVGSGVTTTATTCKFDFLNSDVHQLLLLDLYFKFSNVTYKITNFTVNSVEIDFSIDGIATLKWSGKGLTLSEDATAHAEISSWTDADKYVAYYAAPTGTSGCVKNRFTTMYLQDNNGGATDGHWYAIPITGGSITIDNGISYLTPEELGKVNSPCGSFTGARSISGSVTAYLNTGNGSGADNGANAKTTAQLLNDVLALTNATSTSYDVTMNMGGKATDTPIVEFAMPSAHLVIPTVNTADVIETEISFTAQGTTGDLSDKDELTITYKPDPTNIVQDKEPG